MKLATIQRVKNVRKHPNADRLKIANVNEYQVVTAADIQDDEHVVYFSLDSILPEIPIFEFLRKNNFRVSMVRLRGEVSNGLIIPFHELAPHLQKDKIYNEGDDVTEELGVKKYSKPIPASLAGEVVGHFPTDILSKTDEERLENSPELFEKFKGKEVYVTIKYDGSSGTFFKKNYDELRVCSRNLELKEDNTNTLWKIAEKYDLYRGLNAGYAIQGEIYGEGIQKNPMKIVGQDIAVFNIIDITTRKLLSLEYMNQICEYIGIPFIPIIYQGVFEWESIQELKDYANQIEYPNGGYAEGIVVRLVEPEFSPELGRELSVKIISENYKD